MRQEKSSQQWLNGSPSLGSMALLPIFFYGIEDGINLCGSATLLVFLYLFTRNTFTVKKIVLFGFSFFVAIYATKGMMIFGTFDVLIAEEKSLLINRVGYCVLGILFVLQGFRCFTAWRKSLVSGSYEIPTDLIPNFFAPTSHPVPFKKREYWNVLVFFGLGVGLALLESVMTHDYHMFWRVNYFLLNGKTQAAMANVFSYISGAMLPLNILWLVLIIATKKGVSSHGRQVPYYQIICSALYLSIGAGLLIQFIG